MSTNSKKNYTKEFKISVLKRLGEIRLKVIKGGNPYVSNSPM